VNIVIDYFLDLFFINCLKSSFDNHIIFMILLSTQLEIFLFECLGTGKTFSQFENKT
jgi:hypothetical protein